MGYGFHYAWPLITFIPLFGFPLALTFALYCDLSSLSVEKGHTPRCIRLGWLTLAFLLEPWILTHAPCKMSMWNSRFVELMFRWCAIASFPCRAMLSWTCASKQAHTSHCSKKPKAEPQAWPGLSWAQMRWPFSTYTYKPNLSATPTKSHTGKIVGREPPAPPKEQDTLSNRPKMNSFL